MQHPSSRHDDHPHPALSTDGQRSLPALSREKLLSEAACVKNEVSPGRIRIRRAVVLGVTSMMTMGAGLALVNSVITQGAVISYSPEIIMMSSVALASLGAVVGMGMSRLGNKFKFRAKKPGATPSPILENFSAEEAVAPSSIRKRDTMPQEIALSLMQALDEKAALRSLPGSTISPQELAAMPSPSRALH